MILQKQHDIFNLFLPLPALLDLKDAFFPDSLHLSQTPDFVFNHLNGICPEFPDNPLREPGTDALDQTGA